MGLGGATPLAYFMKKNKKKTQDIPDKDGYTSDTATRLLHEEGNRFKKAKTSFQHIQRLDDTGEEVKAERVVTDNGFTEQRSMRKVGSIPSIFLMQPKYKDILSDDKKAFKKAVKRFFTDHPEFRICNQNY